MVGQVRRPAAVAEIRAARPLEADAAIVFVRTRADVEEVSLELSGRGFRAAGISGDVAQTERERMVERLKNGSLDVLVATDVAARGLDVERISLVVNFDVPREPEMPAARKPRPDSSRDTSSTSARVRTKTMAASASS